MDEAGDEQVFRLAPTPAAAAQARRIIDEVGKGLERELRFRAQLLASELVANSIRHAQLDHADLIELRISPRPSRLRVEVWDTGPGFEPDALLPGSDAVSGRGIALLDALAERWGTAQRAQHFGVWFEIDAHDQPPLEPQTDTVHSHAVVARHHNVANCAASLNDSPNARGATLRDSRCAKQAHPLRWKARSWGCDEGRQGRDGADAARHSSTNAPRPPGS